MEVIIEISTSKEDSGWDILTDSVNVGEYIYLHSTKLHLCFYHKVGKDFVWDMNTDAVEAFFYYEDVSF